MQIFGGSRPPSLQGIFVYAAYVKILEDFLWTSETSPTNPIVLIKPWLRTTALDQKTEGRTFKRVCFQVPALKFSKFSS